MESSVKLAVTQMTRAKKRSVLFSNHDLPLLAKRHLPMVPVMEAVPLPWGLSETVEEVLLLLRPLCLTQHSHLLLINL